MKKLIKRSIYNQRLALFNIIRIMVESLMSWWPNSLNTAIVVFIREIDISANVDSMKSNRNCRGGVLTCFSYNFVEACCVEELAVKLSRGNFLL